MFKLKPIACFIVWGLVLATFPRHSISEEKIEGTVISTNLTSCSVVPGKVGTCEGTLVLETKENGTPRRRTVKVTRDTTLKKGDDKLFLFQLQGGTVTVNYITEKGEKVVRSVVMKTQK